LVGSPRKCGWSAVQTKVLYRSAHFIAIAVPGQAETRPISCRGCSLARPSEQSEQSSPYQKVLLHPHWSLSRGSSILPQPPDAQTRKNHSYHPRRRKLPKSPLSQSPGSVRTPDRITDCRQELFFPWPELGCVGRRRQPHPASGAQEFPGHNQSALAPRPTKLTASRTAQDQRRRIPDLPGRPRVAKAKHPSTVGSRVPKSLQHSGNRNAPPQTHLRPSRDRLRRCAPGVFQSPHRARSHLPTRRPPPHPRSKHHLNFRRFQFPAVLQPLPAQLSTPSSLSPAGATENSPARVRRLCDPCWVNHTNENLSSEPRWGD
jgi:hypothetical protein